MGEAAACCEGSKAALVNWSELLDPGNGGPGEPPGRPELIEQLQEERLCQPIDTVQQKKRRRKKK